MPDIKVDPTKESVVYELTMLWLNHQDLRGRGPDEVFLMYRLTLEGLTEQYEKNLQKKTPKSVQEKNKKY